MKSAPNDLIYLSLGQEGYCTSEGALAATKPTETDVRPADLKNYASSWNVDLLQRLQQRGKSNLWPLELPMAWFIVPISPPRVWVAGLGVMEKGSLGCGLSKPIMGFQSPRLVGTLPQALFFFRKMAPRFLGHFSGNKSPRWALKAHHGL